MYDDRLFTDLEYAEAQYFRHAHAFVTGTDPSHPTNIKFGTEGFSEAISNFFNAILNFFKKIFSWITGGDRTTENAMNQAKELRSKIEDTDKKILKNFDKLKEIRSKTDKDLSDTVDTLENAISDIEKSINDANRIETFIVTKMHPLLNLSLDQLTVIEKFHKSIIPKANHIWIENIGKALSGKKITKPFDDVFEENLTEEDRKILGIEILKNGTISLKPDKDMPKQDDTKPSFDDILKKYPGKALSDKLEKTIIQLDDLTTAFKKLSKSADTETKSAQRILSSKDDKKNNPEVVKNVKNLFTSLVTFSKVLTVLVARMRRRVHRYIVCLSQYRKSGQIFAKSTQSV